MLYIGYYIDKRLSSTFFFLKNPLLTNTFKTVQLPNYRFKSKIFLNKSFTNYLNLSLSTQKLTLKPHFSYKSFFIKSKTNGTNSFLNIGKFYKKYTNFTHLLFNINFYSIKILTYGNSFFKSEILGLNWLVLSHFLPKLRLNKILFLFSPISRGVDGPRVITLLKQYCIPTAFIIDVFSHKTTLGFLTKINTLTIGISPITYDSKDIDISIPIITDSIFSQLFFLKVKINIYKISERVKYCNYNKMWDKFRM